MLSVLMNCRNICRLSDAIICKLIYKLNKLIEFYSYLTGFFSLLFGFIGTYSHNGRLIAISCLMMSLGSFVMVIPHAIGGNYQLGPLPIDTCDLGGKSRMMKLWYICYFWLYQ